MLLEIENETPKIRVLLVLFWGIPRRAFEARLVVFINLGPFHVIVERCNAAVFESRLLELVVQSKWERNVWPKLRWIIVG